MNQVIKSDILVVGGGVAGCFAAIKAREAGVTVTLVDKGYATRSGQTPFATDMLVFNPDWGHNWDEWMNQVTCFGEYLNDRTWTEMTFRESYACYEDMLAYGVTFIPDEDGTPERVRLPGGFTEFIRMTSMTWTAPLRNHMKKIGVNLVDRVMIGDLLTKDGAVVGAVGIPMDGEDPVVFEAGAVILCTGASGLKGPGFPYGALTADGEALALRVGATVTGKEFQDPHFTKVEAPADGIGPMPPEDGHRALHPKGKLPNFKMFDGNGEALSPHPEGSSKYSFAYMDLEFSIHQGNGPIYWHMPDGVKIEMVGGSTLGMANRKCDGVAPADYDCSSGVPGLYVAGDTCATYASGVIYSTLGSCITGGALTGGLAAKAAASYITETGVAVVDEAEIARSIDFIYAPRRRTSGFSPQWILETLRNQMMPYYISYIKKGDRLQGALVQVEFMRDHLLPKMYARDAHDLRLANEVRNMVYNAEAKLRCSLFREESRGCHYREDFPNRDDENWLAWTQLKLVDGKMVLSKKLIPDEWKLNLHLPYAQRYPYRFPNDRGEEG